MRHPICSFAASSVLLIAACSSSNGKPSGSAGDGGSNPRTLADGGLSIGRAVSGLSRDPASAIPASVLDGAVAANNAFAVDLYAHVRSGAPAGNLLTSPISASFALTMTYAGAAGNTAAQMATALHYGAAATAIFDGQNALSQALDGRAASALAGAQSDASGGDVTPPSPSDYQLQIVNSVWGQSTYPWAEPFLDVLAKSYGAGVYLEDFVHQWEPARTDINTWVSDETAGKIQDLLPEGSLDKTTRLVLVNAIHLKLPWENPFTPSATAKGTFTAASGAQVTPDMMNLEHEFPYVDDGQAQIVSLPLAGSQLSVVIALPHGDLTTYESALSSGSAALTSPSSSADVVLSLPKFSFTTPTFSLAAALKAMGMPDAFDGAAADFTPMCPSLPDGGRLYISDVLQKAMIGVEENGVEAAAATAVIVDRASIALPPPTPVPMVVNRPFLISIIDAPTGAVLFLGHVDDPTAS